MAGIHLSSTSIYARLLTAFLLVVLALALVIGSASVWAGYRIGLGRSLDQLSSVARLKSAEIDLWTGELMLGLDLALRGRDLEAAVALLLQNGTASTASASAETASAETAKVLDLLEENLRDVEAKARAFSRLCILDAKGKVLASTDPAWSGAELGDTEYYRQGLQQDFIARPFHSERDGQLVVVAAHPLVVPGRGAVGILAGWSDISFLDGIMAEQTGLGKTGESYLVGTDFHPLTALRPGIDPSPGTLESDDGARRAVEDKVNGQGSYRDYRGVRVLGVYSWLPAIGVALLVEQDLAEALEPVTTMLGISLGVMMAAVLIAMAVAAAVARGIAAPLHTLSETAALIAGGDLSRVLDLRRRDEIGHLAAAFDNMSSRLRTLIAELEDELEERKASEEQLRASEARNRTIIQTAMDGFWRVDLMGRLLEVNETYCWMSGFGEDELVGRSVSDFEATETREDSLAHIARVIERGSDRFESRHRRKDGSAYDIESSVQYKPDEGGMLVSFLRDITERKRAEEEVRRSLAEKETLLRELHHRTKNNMGVIIAMLDLQAARIGDERLLKAFADTKDRIRSMALAHQKLYEAKDLSRLDLGAYLRDLVGLLEAGYVSLSGRVGIAADLGEVPVLIDTAIPCGLILNELLTNAFKYAFPMDRKGEIRIGLRRREDGVVELSVSDDGVGLPPGFDPRKDGNMGLQTIYSLGEQQLFGEVVMESGQGTRCRILFRADRFAARV